MALRIHDTGWLAACCYLCGEQGVGQCAARTGGSAMLRIMVVSLGVIDDLI